MSNKHRSTQVAIVGAGITGLCLAAALKKRGIECLLFERASAFSGVGAGIQLAPNAVRLLYRLGLEGALEQVGVKSTALEVRSGMKGNVLGRIDQGAKAEAMFGAPFYFLARADLHAALRSIVPADAIKLDTAAISAMDGADGAHLFLADGTSVTAEVVVGADGIHSKIRQSRLPDKPMFAGYSIYRGMVPVQRLPVEFSIPQSVMWTGPGKHFVCYPVSAGRMVNYVATVPTAEWPKESWSEPGNARDVLSAFDGWDKSIQMLVDATDSVTRWGLHTRDAEFSWSTTFTTLAGDAAHPMLPFMAQGGNQGIEDALTLAAALSQSKDVPDALRLYESLRRPRTVKVQRSSQEMTQIFHQSDEAVSKHDPGRSGNSLLKAMDWLFGYDAEILSPAT